MNFLIDPNSVDTAPGKNSQKKKVYNTESDRLAGPYYDPRDIHIHQWTHGNIVPQNSKVQTIVESGPGKKQHNVCYCVICHEVKHKACDTTTKISSVYKIDEIKASVRIDSALEKEIAVDLSFLEIERQMNIVDSVFKVPVSKPRSGEITKTDLKKILNSGLFILPGTARTSDDIIMYSTV